MILSQSRFHFVGIGGIGMCGLAELLKNMGATVTGSDLSNNPQIESLQSKGVKVLIGHRIENLSGGRPDVVVYSGAVPSDNVELQFARRHRIPIIARAEALGEIMRLKRGVAVSGTHGKTTTTSMIASIFAAAGTDPTVIVGGRVKVFESTARLGQGEWMIAEADESDGSFHRLCPEISVITNIDNDHLDYFQSFENLQKAFLEFASRSPFYGHCIVYGDDPRTRELFKNFSKPLSFYGFGRSNDFFASGSKNIYDIFHQGEFLGPINLSLPGAHNALNALASIATSMAAGLPFEKCALGIKNFEGVDRRMQFLGQRDAILFYDDYGHHPTEIRATIQAFQEKYPQRRLVICFQPHRYSRTELCWKEFLTCFKGVHKLFILDIYAAGESPRGEISSQELCRKMVFPEEDARQYVGSDPVKVCSNQLQAGDVFVTLGAGSVYKLGPQILGLK